MSGTESRLYLYWLHELRVIEMEELVQQISDIELAVSVKTACMKRETKGTDQRIAEIEHDLKVLREHRVGEAAPYLIGIADDERRIDEIKAQIIDEWTGEDKTMVFDAGILKFRTTQSLKIYDEELLLHDIIEHTSIRDASKTYIKGFNLTAVKKYMTVHPQQPEVAELTSKTTVKLEQKSG